MICSNAATQANACDVWDHVVAGTSRPTIAAEFSRFPSPTRFQCQSRRKSRRPSRAIHATAASSTIAAASCASRPLRARHRRNRPRAEVYQVRPQARRASSCTSATVRRGGTTGCASMSGRRCSPRTRSVCSDSTAARPRARARRRKPPSSWKRKLRRIRDGSPRSPATIDSSSRRTAASSTSSTSRPRGCTSAASSSTSRRSGARLTASGARPSSSRARGPVGGRARADRPQIAQMLTGAGLRRALSRRLRRVATLLPRAAGVRHDAAPHVRERTMSREPERRDGPAAARLGSTARPRSFASTSRR